MSLTTTTPGRFVWHELATQDQEGSRAFYGEVFGWSFQQADTSAMPYTLVLSDGVAVGGMMTAKLATIPTHWMPYISVTDVDAAAKRANDAGCLQLMAAVTIPPGRFCVMQDPQGAVFTLFRSALGDPPETARAQRGAFGWDELDTRDPEAAFAVYQKIFGWTRTTVPGLPQVTVLMRGAEQAASLQRSRSSSASGNAWLSFVVIDDLAATRRRTERMGGKVLVECMRVPEVGAFTVLQDNAGARIAAFAYR